MQIRSLQKKRALRSVLLVLLLSAVGMGKMYAQSFTMGDLNYQVNEDGVSVTVTGHVDGQNATGSLVIPETVEYNGSNYSVTAIGNSAFYGCSGLTGDLVIPNSVTTLGNYVFYGCYGFTGSLTISNSVTTIGNSAFRICRGFTGSLILPGLLTGIGERTFEECYGFTGNLVIPNSVTMVGDYAFYHCSGLTGSLNIPNSLTMIGDGAFSGCIGLSGSLTIGSSLTTIGTNAFSDCNGFFTITSLSETPPSLGYNSFSSFYSNKPVYVPCGYEEEYASVSWGGFNDFIGYCGGMVSVVAYPETGGEVIGGGMFEAGQTCTLTATANEGYFLAYWTLNGNRVSAEPEYTFYVAGDMTLVAHFIQDGDIAFADANVKAICVTNWDTDEDGELSYAEAAAVTDLGQVFYYKTGITSFNELKYFTGLTSIGRQAFQGCSGLTSIVIPNSVASIGFCAFYYCTGLTSIIIPNSVISIGSSAFTMCSRLSSIEIPNSVTSIGSSAFSNCTGLTSIDIPDSVTSIEYDAFWRCTSLTTVTIPQSVTSMGENPFAGCSGLEHIIVDSWNTAFDSRENCNAIIETSTNELVTGCKNTTIPNSVTSIGFAAFSGCSGLTSINIPNSVISIGNFAFVNCNSLASIAMSNSLTSIGHYAFWYCSGLTSIDIPNSVTFISHGAFESCSGLATVTIPSSVTSIESNPFGDCDGLEQIVVDSGNTVYDSREDCNAIIETNTNTIISGCKNTVIPNSVTSIGFSAFYGCSGLASINIPNSVIYIDYEAFNYCDGLTSITVLAVDPPVLDDDVFYDVSKEIPVYVPYNTIGTYQTASHWCEFMNYQEICYTTISGYGESEGNYRFIASPLVENTAPTAVDNMITETAYDLYRFDQSEDAEWQNYKFPENTPNFFLANGQGYLYANAEDVNLIFKGEFNEDETKEVGLVYDTNADFAGWNLVGNPFPVNAYVNRSYYTMNEDGTAVEPNMVSSATAILACTGVMVMAESEGETVVFSTEAPEAATNQGCLQIAVAQTNERGTSTGSVTALDKAILSFNAGDRLEKFVFNKENAVISIPQGGKELAIACSNKQGEMPLNFKATKNGEYTLTIHPEAVELDYLHLIDNLTGADVDLLVTPAYTFTGKTTDYASRFRLVFSANGYADGDDEAFAFIYNGDIVFTGMGGDAFNTSLQIVDVQGRVIVCRDAVPASLSTAGMTPGVYVLRLVNGDEVRTQKLVVR